jgi:catecholate siderophore receptor
MKQKRQKFRANAPAKQSRRFRHTRGWIAAGTLAAYAVMGGTRQALAAAERTDPNGNARQQLPFP